MNDLSWYYAADGKKIGPLRKQELQEMIEGNELPANNPVWHRSLDDWQPATTVQELGLAPPPLPGKSHDAPAKGGPATEASPTISAPTPNDPTAKTPVTEQAEPRYAGFWLRAGALLADFVVIFVAAFFATVFLAPLIGFEAAEVLVNLTGIIGAWLYFAGMESSSYQATFGKRALGLKVTDVEGKPLGFGKATGRHFGKIISGLIFYIGFVMAGITEKKQALHDMMAGCMVVRGR